MVVTDRRLARRQATKEEILEAAWRQIAEVGVGELSLRRVAADVGMRAPSLYVYFPSKNALYDALFADAAAEFQERYRRAVSAPDPEAALRAGLACYLRFALENPGKFQLHFQRPVPSFQPSEASFDIARDTYELFRHSLERMVEARKLHPRVLEQRSLDLLTAISSGLASQQLSNEPDASFAKGRWTSLVDEVIDMQKMFFAPDVNKSRRATGKE